MSEGTVLSFKRKPQKPDGRYYRGLVRGLVVGVGLAAIALVVFAKPEAQSKLPLSIYYPNCKAAHDAGVYSIRRGELGYRPQLDADSDGLACEPIPVRR
jgi:hypothetical protein